MDRLRATMQALTDAAPRPPDYSAFYQAKVVAQDGQTLDLEPLDQRIPSMSGVPIWHGLPGVEVEVEPEAIVLLGFRDASPAAPFAMLWQSETLKSLRVTATGPVEVKTDGDVKVDAGGSVSVVGTSGITLCNGVQGVARMGDSVQAGPYGGTITAASTQVKAG